MHFIMPLLTGGNRRRKRRYKILKERKQGGCTWLLYVEVGWSGKGLARDIRVEQSPALVGLGWRQMVAGQRW